MKSAGFIFVALLGAFMSRGQSFPDKFSRVPVASGINQPTAMAFAPDGRIFVTEQTGNLRVIKNGALLTTPFVELNVDSRDERGLLGIAMDPNFVSNGFIYLYYTFPTIPIHNRVSRFTANGDVAVPGSEQIILELDNLGDGLNHNGGSLAFGVDGKLYIAAGENNYGANAQDLDTHLGKILRINIDGSVPAGNPFTTGSEQRKRVWAFGLRNPYTIAVQPVTGKLFVNDVGQSSKEEINDATQGGLNFGWPDAEGSSANPAFRNPVFAYDHGSGDGNGCAITGGAFFNPASTTYPASYVGKYFYVDLCNGWMNYIDVSGASAVRFPFGISIGVGNLSLVVGPDGNLYYISYFEDVLYKIVYDNTAAPEIQMQPVDLSVLQGQPALFTVTATGIPAVSYQWQKNNVNISGATQNSFTIDAAQPSDNALYSVIVSNSVGSVTSNSASLSVIPVLGVEEEDIELILYPSPARKWLYLLSKKDRIESVELCNHLGQVNTVLLPEWISQTLVAVDVSSLSTGMYLLFIHSSAGDRIRKVMIQR